VSRHLELLCLAEGSRVHRPTLSALLSTSLRTVREPMSPSQRQKRVKYGTVATGKNVHTRAVRLRLIYSLKTLAHFRPKVLVDFLNSFTQINELTGAITAIYILRRIYLNNNYNYTILHSTILN
jgi:hypothetical protein